MKKEELVAKGLSEEHAQTVIDAYTEEMKGMIPKSRFDEINEQLKTANSTIETLKKSNKDNEALQNEVKSYKEKITALELSASNAKKEYALKAKLTENGIIDADYVIYKQGGLDKFKFDEQGTPAEVDKLVEGLKASMPQIFKKPGIDYKPAGGTGGMPGKNPFAKDSFNLTEQGRLLKENPEQAKAFAAAAGMNI